MKNGDASQTRCSNQTETRCTSVRDLIKYTRTPDSQTSPNMYPMIPWVPSQVACLVNVSGVEGGEMVLNPPEVEPRRETFFFPASPCAEK